MTTFNKAYRNRNFFGTDHYTSDSDAVCILQHNTNYKITDEEPMGFEGISLFFRVAKGRNSYASNVKNGIRSRKCGQFDGHSIKYEGFEYLKNIGN